MPLKNIDIELLSNLILSPALGKLTSALSKEGENVYGVSITILDLLENV